MGSLFMKDLSRKDLLLVSLMLFSLFLEQEFNFPTILRASGFEVLLGLLF